MIHPSTSQQLFQLAEPWHGYFTAAQARAEGINLTRLPVMANRGQIERVSRGVYRLPQFPVSDVAQYIEAVLWPQGIVGVLSHESALLLHGLSDVSPAQIHITVPAHYRVRRAVPKHLRIHHENLTEEDSEKANGVPVTTPYRSIIDCSKDHLSSALIRQAIEDGKKSGKLTRHETASLATQLGLEITEDLLVAVGAK